MEEIEGERKEEYMENKEEAEKKQENGLEESKTQNKILKRIFIAMGVFVVVILIAVYGISSLASFKYKGVDFKMIKEGDLIFYQTSIPVGYTDKITGDVVSADYNFYLRNDPRKLEKQVPIVGGNVTFKKNMVLELTTENLYCQGDWMIGLQNSINLYNLLGFNLTAENETVAYLPPENYMFIIIKEANQTNINKIGETTYEMNVNNCEVLAAFERLMVEAFVKCKEVGCGWT